MRDLASRFLHDHAVALLCFAMIAAIIGWACHARMRRVRERDRLAREVEDALLQNAQGLILQVHGIVKNLDENDPMRQRLEHALDQADEQLSEDRDRVQDLRAEATHESEALHRNASPQPPSGKGAMSAPSTSPSDPQDRKSRASGWLRFKRPR